MAGEDEVVDIFSATDLSTLEGLVFADDRLKYLDENFSKGDESYWFYRLLTLQKHFGSSLTASSKTLASALEKVKKVENVKDSKNIEDLLLRQAVINYERSTVPIKRQTLAKLKTLIGANLETTQQGSLADSSRQQSETYPSSLNLNTRNLLTKAWNQFNNIEKRNDLKEVFTSVAADFLANQKLNAVQTSEFLDLIEDESPEVPYLLTYIKNDLKNGTEFGDKLIHFRLTKEHLELLKNVCQQSESYMRCYAWKLRKVTDVSYEYDLKAREKYLKDLKDFAEKTLAKNPKFNSLRALILFNWLVFAEEQGVYNKQVLKTYMKIPKISEYCKELYANTRHCAKLDYEVDLIRELYPITDDTPYIRRALRHVFQNFDDNLSKWKDVVDSKFLKKLYCEVKLMKGQGRTADLRRAYGKFGKYAFQELCQEVNIELLRNNKVYYNVDDSVTLTLLLKNVPELEIRIYQIDCKEYFLRFKDRVSLDIPLDGLAPNYVLHKTYDDQPLSQRTRKIDLKELQGRRGVFLIEFFGNGKKTRALIRKGELRYISQQEFKDENDDGGLGYQFRIFDEENQPVLSPEVFMNGKRYTSEDETGSIFIPFAEEDYEGCPLILEDIDNPGSATIHFFDYKTENYRLECGMFIDRESLLEKREAQVILRPTLLLNEMPVSVDNLKNIQLTIETTDAQDFIQKRVINVEFLDNAETVQTFVVPNELRCVSLSLTCDVYSLSQKVYLQLENDESFRINDIDKTNALADMHLIPRGSYGYVLAVLGKNGEPYKNVVVEVELTHRYFQEKLKYSLQTDNNGNIILGRLPDITTLEATAASELVYQGVDDETKHTWILCHDQVNVPKSVNVAKGKVVRIPFMASEGEPKIDVYDIDFVKKFTQVSYRNGYIEIKNLPGGVFQVFIRDTQEAEVVVYVSQGDTFGSHCVTKNRIIELSEERPLQITEVQGNRTNGYRVQLMGHNEGTRVHIFSTHLVPRFSCYSFLASPEIPPSVVNYVAYPGLYGDMESVSQEFQYIANRKNANKYSGNLLERPTLLTKRWTTAGPVRQRSPPEEAFVEETEFVQTETHQVAKEAKYDPYLTKIQFDSSNLEFLAEPSMVHVNLPVDGNGTVLIPPEYITGNHNILQIVAVDEDNTCLRNVMLQDDGQQPYRDVRLTNVLNPEIHWTERREILELREPGEVLFIENFATSDIETYDDLSDVFELYCTLSGEQQLKSFKFLTKWDTLNLEKKLEYYDRYQCAEVNFYIFNKDIEFFETVIQPILRSKVQKDFMDLYLLQDDISSFVSVIKYQSLNTLERILLASRIADLVDPTIKYLADAVSGLPELPQESDELFQAALEAKQLAADSSDTWQKRRYTVAPEPLDKIGDIIDQTREFQETRYYKVPFDNQSADLVPPSRFWLDYARYLLSGESEHFLSKQFHTPVKNLTQMLLALAVIALPFRTQVVDPTMDFVGTNGANMTVQSPTIVLSRQIKESVVQTSALAVSTNYFDPEEPFEYVDFERQDKFLKMPLLTQKVYGCRVVITNVSSMTHTVELLNQIPQGSIPVYDGFRTKNIVEELEPYTTKHREFYFYFPTPGNFTHYQTRVSKNGKVIGFGKEDPNVVVVDPEDVVDTTSWEYFSTKASNSELLEHLRTSVDVHKEDLSKIAWRMEDEEMFMNVTAILRDRQIYSDSIWAYSMKYFRLDEVKEYLSMQPKFLDLISPDLQSSVITDFDAFNRQTFQIMEYWPLTAPRAHYHEFKNDFFQSQYLKYLKRAFYRSSSVESMLPDDQMAGVYYFLVQNRVQDALNLFEKIFEGDAREASAFTYDYLRAYLAFYSQDVNEITNAATLCETYLAQTLTPSKSALWQGVLDYLSELKEPSFSDNLFDPTTEADIRSARAKKLDCEVNSDRTITITYKNVDSVEINFYQTDIELQFSTAPFRQESNAFNFVAPTDSVVVDDLDPAERSATIDLPASLHDKSSVVEVIGGGMTVSRANYDNHLKIEISQKLRQIRVCNSTTNAAIAKAYVKVYCQTPDAPDGRFLKDGYTDLRGRFDYATVSTDEMKFVKALAILVLTDSAGADVLEVGI